MKNSERVAIAVTLLLLGALVCWNPSWVYRGVYAIMGGVPASGWYTLSVTNATDGDVDVRAVLLQPGRDNSRWELQRESAGWVTEIRETLAAGGAREFAFPTDGDPWNAAVFLIAQRGDRAETFQTALYHVVWPKENGRPVLNRRGLKIPVEITGPDFGGVDAAAKLRVITMNEDLSAL